MRLDFVIGAKEAIGFQTHACRYLHARASNNICSVRDAVGVSTINLVLDPVVWIDVHNNVAVFDYGFK